MSKPAHTHLRRVALTATGLLALLASPHADAGGGATPSKIAVTLQAELVGVTEVGLVAGDTTQLPVYTHDASAPTNPEGISVIRGGNHKIPRKSPGHPLALMRAVGDADGSVVVLYLDQMSRYLRVIKPDNTLGFEVYKPGHRLAGVAGDGAGGAYLASHIAYKPPGSALADQTKHTTTHYSNTGAVLWEVARPPVPSPYSVTQHTSVAARSGEGVFVGYSVHGRDTAAKPIVLHQAEADGATIFVNDDLRGPKLSAGKIVPGEVGTGELQGQFRELVAAQDGSLLATVHAHGHQEYIVRFDAAGQQTAIYVCDGHAQAIQPREIACVEGHGATFDLVRYGIADGNLAPTIAKWTAPVIPGWTLSQLAGTPGRQILLSGRIGDDLAMALLSKNGALLTKIVIPGDRVLSTLGVDAGGWIGAGNGVVRGTYSVGGNAGGTSSPMNTPTPRPRGGAVPR